MPNRRTLLASATLAAGAAFGLCPALAEQRFANISMFIPAGPGGGWDQLGRAIEQVARGGGLVGNIQFENVPGAGGTVGLPRFIATRRNRPDALMVSGSIMIGAVLTNRTPVGITNLTPVARLTQETGAIVVAANSEFRTIADLLQALRTNPGAVSIAGGSGGGIDHITLGLMLRALGRQAREGSFVAFAGGGPSLAAIMGGQVKGGISGWAEFSEQIRAGRLRALATTGEHRIDPDVPTLKESGVDVVTSNWRGVFGAPGINANARAGLTTLITEMHALPAWRALLEQRGWEDAFMTGEAFDRFIAQDIRDTETVLKEIGLA